MENEKHPRGRPEFGPRSGVMVPVDLNVIEGGLEDVDWVFAHTSTPRRSTLFNVEVPLNCAIKPIASTWKCFARDSFDFGSVSTAEDSQHEDDFALNEDGEGLAQPVSNASPNQTGDHDTCLPILGECASPTLSCSRDSEDSYKDAPGSIGLDKNKHGHSDTLNTHGEESHGEESHLSSGEIGSELKETKRRWCMSTPTTEQQSLTMLTQLGASAPRNNDRSMLNEDTPGSCGLSQGDNSASLSDFHPSQLNPPKTKHPLEQATENELKKQTKRSTGKSKKKVQKKSLSIARAFSPKGLPQPRTYTFVPVSTLKPSAAGNSDLRRSKRAKIAPLKHWCGEKVVYGPNDFGDEYDGVRNMSAVAGIELANTTPYKKKIQPKTSRSKYNRKTRYEDDEFDLSKMRKKFRVMNGTSANLLQHESVTTMGTNSQRSKTKRQPNMFVSILLRDCIVLFRIGVGARVRFWWSTTTEGSSHALFD